MGIHATYVPFRPEQVQHYAEAPASDWPHWIGDVAADAELGEIGKAWDSLWWMLDPARRDGYQNGVQPSTVLGRAVMGAHVLNMTYAVEQEGYRPGDIYYHTRYLTVEEVAASADAFDALTERDLEAVFDPARMHEEGYYVDQPFETIVEEVARLRAFYRRAADRGRAVVVSVG